MAPVATHRPEDEILDELGQIRRRIDEHQTALDALYERRVDVYREARDEARKADGGPGLVLQRKLGDASGISEVMVIQALRKAEAAETT